MKVELMAVGNGYVVKDASWPFDDAYVFHSFDDAVAYLRKIFRTEPPMVEDCSNNS